MNRSIWQSVATAVACTALLIAVGPVTEEQPPSQSREHTWCC